MLKATGPEPAEVDSSTSTKLAVPDAEPAGPDLSMVDSTVLAHIGIGVVLLDPQGFVTHANDKAAGLLGVPTALLQEGASFDAVVKLAQRQDGLAPSDTRLLSPSAGVAGGEASKRCDLTVTGGGIVEMRSTPLPDGGSIRTLTDVGHDRQMLAELHRQAATDPLTGVANRRYFLSRFQREIDRHKRYATDIALLIMDIDHFKVINDRHGHAIGDAALKAISLTSLSSLRKVDLLGRIGGEEFGVLLPKTRIETAVIVAERLRHAIAACPVRIGSNESVYVTASIGVAAIRPTDDEPEPIMVRADSALYRAKEAGRNRVCIDPRQIVRGRDGSISGHQR